MRRQIGPIRLRLHEPCQIAGPTVSQDTQRAPKNVWPRGTDRPPSTPIKIPSFFGVCHPPRVIGTITRIPIPAIPLGPAGYQLGFFRYTWLLTSPSATKKTMEVWEKKNDFQDYHGAFNGSGVRRSVTLRAMWTTAAGFRITSKSMTSETSSCIDRPNCDRCESRRRTMSAPFWLWSVA